MWDRWFTVMIVGLGILTVAMVVGALYLTEIDNRAHLDSSQKSRVR
jgi:hypothetical protein